ncbi:MAG: LptF/LptG family permease [Aquificaceae bacterium]
MIFLWFFWKVLRVALLISFVLTLLFLITQIVRIDQIILNLPLKDSLSFLFFWFFYYFSYLLPLSIFIAFSLNLFELKESKKLNILQAFGVDPRKIYAKSLLYALPLIIALSATFYLLDERDIGYLRNQLMFKYYTIIITSIPPKSFHTFGQFTLHVENREGGKLEGVFLRFQEGVVIAQRAYVREEEILFEKGSLLTQREGKTFSTDFDRYRLNLKKVIAGGKEGHRKGYIVGTLNAFLSLMLMGASYLMVERMERHHRFYYTIGLLSLLYQFLLLLIKQSL